MIFNNSAYSVIGASSVHNGDQLGFNNHGVVAAVHPDDPLRKRLFQTADQGEARLKRSRITIADSSSLHEDTDHTSPCLHDVGGSETGAEEILIEEDQGLHLDIQAAARKFKSQHEDMVDEQKWQLKSGRYVEDIIYNNMEGKNLENILAAKDEAMDTNGLYLPIFFILNPSQQCIESWFTPKEFKQVQEQQMKTRSLPDLPQNVQQLLDEVRVIRDKYALEAVRNRMFTEKHLKNKNIEEYVGRALTQFMALYESTERSAKDNSEAWLVCNVHHHFLDALLQMTS
ncbi:MAG: hypothetical protein M1822_008856 [Bathelium mastoideum]|nr:MAG: hypothetical protein M1822_008856 [Bathelium mastoideum]